MSPYRIILAVVPALLLGGQCSRGSGLGSGRAQNDFPELADDFEMVCQAAFDGSHEPYLEQVPLPLPDFDPPVDGVREHLGLVYEEYNLIRTRGWLYNDKHLWVTPRPRGNVHKESFEVWSAPGAGHDYRRRTYRVGDYDYWPAGITPPLPPTIPEAARVITSLDFGAALGQSGGWPQFGHLGANAYFRLTGLTTLFGTSLRLTGYDVGFKEAKPRLTKVYVRPLPSGRLALLGVIESAPFNACVQTVATADLSTRLQTTLRFYPRPGGAGRAGAKASPLAMSSMFWTGEAQTPQNPHDAAHDADTMAVCGQESFPLQGFIPAVGQPLVFRDFGAAPCFGLMQRDRDPAHYADYAAANYAQRVNLWVDDLRSDLPYTVKLMAYGTNYEGEDNVVAYVEFRDALPVPQSAATGATFSYTLTASALPPPQTGPRIAFSDSGPGNMTGQAVAMSGTTLAVGAPFILNRQGSVYLFKRSPFGLIAQRQLTPHDGLPGDHFGSSVAMAGDTLAVAAPTLGAVYVFVRRGQDWVEQARLPVPVTYSAWALGYPLSITDDRLAVGIPGNGGGKGATITDGGAVYVFRREDESWSREAILQAADRETGDHFGAALALDGDRLAIGAPGDDDANAWEQGSVYLFERTGNAWAQTAKLTEPGGWKDYGAAVALSGGQLLVGVPRAHGTAWRTAAGSVCSYTVKDGTWSLDQCFRPAEGRNGDAFGTAVSLRGATVLIGAPGAQQGRGAAWVYHFAGGKWVQGDRLTATARAGGPFGAAVATDGTAQLIGAPPVPGQEQTVQGEAHVFPPLGP